MEAGERKAIISFLIGPPRLHLYGPFLPIKDTLCSSNGYSRNTFFKLNIV